MTSLSEGVKMKKETEKSNKRFSVFSIYISFLFVKWKEREFLDRESQSGTAGLSRGVAQKKSRQGTGV